MKKRIRLNITKPVQDFAKKHGAYFDESDGNWYVDDDLPPELEDFSDKEQRRRDYVSEKLEQCQLCGCQMHLFTHADGPYWRCSAIRCGGSKIFKLHGELKKPIEIIFHSKLNEVDGCFKKNEAPQKVKELAIEITSTAIKLFHNSELAKKWLESPKLALNQKTPIETMTDVDGCDRVKKLLLERFE
jgi:hypothetical protein